MNVLPVLIGMRVGALGYGLRMLILASGSPRRHELLEAAGMRHVVRAAAVDETVKRGEEALAFVKRLAKEKAEAVECGPEDVVLGADTVVCIEGEILGKPRDEADARRMLRLLSGRRHEVHTGICLRSGQGDVVTDAATTAVWLAELSEKEISEYTRSGEPADKAGGYAIQGLASKFAVSIEGSYQNVVGLPVSLVYQRLKEFEV